MAFRLEKIKKWKVPALVVGVAGIVVGGIFLAIKGKGDETFGMDIVTCERGDLVQSAKFHGTIEANESRAIFSLVNGRVDKILVEDNQFVHAGDPLVLLDATEAELALKKSEVALDKAKEDRQFDVDEQSLNLTGLQNQLKQDLDENVLLAQQSLLNAQDAYQDAAEQYNLAKANLDQGLVESIAAAKQSLFNAENDFEYAKDNDDISGEEKAKMGVAINHARVALEVAKQEAYDQVANYQRKMEEALTLLNQAKENYEAAVLAEALLEKRYQLALNRAGSDLGIDSAQVDVEQANENLSHYTITSPIDGYVSSISVKIGDNLENAKQLMCIQNYDAAKVKVDVDEYDLSYFEMDAKVGITVLSLGKEYEGHVVEKSMSAIQKNDIAYINTTILFYPEEQISSGLGAQIEIVKEESLDTLFVPADAIQYDDETMEPYVQVMEGKKLVNKYVEVGLVNADNAEILSGLTEGEEVYINRWD